MDFTAPPAASAALPLATRVRRFAAVANMVVTIYAGYKSRQIWGAITGASKSPEYYDSWNQRAAEIARDTALRLEGLLIKACQFAGSRADILPPQFIDTLAQLQDRVPPRPFSQIRPWLESQLGRPLQECYAEIEETPIASASLAQVHRGRLHDGQVVAIKIQYPEIERLIASDLDNFAFFIRLLARIERTFDFRILLDELYKYVPLELDFVNEAANARRFGRDFAGNASVRFPVPIEALCTRTVLTMDYIDGVKITDLAGLERIGVSKHAVAELLASTYIRQILVYGFFHGDPHPGNLLVQNGEDGLVLVILDLGLAKEFTPALRDGLIKLTTAIIAQDTVAIGAAFRDLGFRTRSGNDDTFVTLAELFLGQALRAGRAYADIGMVERINEELMRALRKNPIVRASSDLLLVLRVMGLLSGIGKTLDSRVDPLAAMMPFLGMSFSPLTPPTK